MTEQHAEPTPGPWTLIWHGNETYPFPLSVHTEDHSCWIARDGTTSSEANARLIAAAPETAAERDRLRQNLINSGNRRVELLEERDRLVKVNEGLVEALDQLIEEKADYMRLNNLGDPEKQHTIKVGRAALAEAQKQ